MLEAAQVKHAHTAIGTAAHKYVDAVGTESNVKHFLIMGNELSLCCQGRNVPNRAGGIDTRGDDKTRGYRVPVKRSDRGGMLGGLGIGQKRQGRELGCRSLARAGWPCNGVGTLRRLRTR